MQHTNIPYIIIEESIPNINCICTYVNTYTYTYTYRQIIYIYIYIYLRLGYDHLLKRYKYTRLLFSPGHLTLPVGTPVLNFALTIPNVVSTMFYEYLLILVKTNFRWLISFSKLNIYFINRSQNKPLSQKTIKYQTIAKQCICRGKWAHYIKNRKMCSLKRRLVRTVYSKFFIYCLGLTIVSFCF